MLDYINSLERDGLVTLGKKYKILGHLSNFNKPLVSDKDLRKAIINRIEQDNVEESGIKSSKKKNSKKRTKSKLGRKKKSLKNLDRGYDLHYKVKNCKSYYKLPEGAKLVAIGDIHGDFSVCIKSLKLAGVIPLTTPNYVESLDELDNIEWIGKNTHIVQLGDQIDRCRPNSWYRDICNDNDTYKDEGSDLKIMELLDKLNEKAQFQGGAVLSILGNHEIMNCVGDFRYVSPKEFEEFGEYFKIVKKNNPNRIFPYGYKERKQAFSPGGMIARKFASNRKSVLQVGKWVFVHGGITPKSANTFTFDEVNKGISDWLLGRRDMKTKEIFELMYDDDDDGIFWTREFGDLGNWEEEKSKKLFHKTLDTINKKNDRDIEDVAEGIIMGHTPQYMNNIGINSSCGGKIWRVDVGASKAFGPFTKCDFENQFRKASVLVIQNDKCRVVKEK